MEGKLRVNKDMTLTLFNRLENAKIPVASQPDFRPRGDGPPPNDEQKKAVVRALSQSITFIWGSPGTGKKDGERVLTTSHTNTAVDQVLKAAKQGMSEQEIEEGPIVRVGQIRKKAKFSTYSCRK